MINWRGEAGWGRGGAASDSDYGAHVQALRFRSHGFRSGFLPPILPKEQIRALITFGCRPWKKPTLVQSPPDLWFILGPPAHVGSRSAALESGGGQG